MDGITKSNYNESCGFRLPCGICTRTNMMCPIWYPQTPQVTWVTDVTTSAVSERSDNGQ